MTNYRMVFLNGKYVAWDQANVHIMCHSFGRGSAIFEVLGLHKTEKGPAIFRLDEHMSRLFRTADMLDMGLPFSPDDLSDAVKETVRKNNIEEGFIKIIGYYPQISFEIIPPQRMLDVAVFVIDPATDLDDNSDVQSATICVSTWAKLDPKTVPVEAKVAANYLNGMMARGESANRGFDYAIMLDTRGFIAEGGTESIFLIKEGRLMTPSLGNILNSITRSSILEAAKVMGIDTFEGQLPPESLYEAGEIFLSGTPNKVLPIRQVEDHVIAASPGPVTRKISDMMRKIVSGREKRFYHWLCPVT